MLSFFTFLKYRKVYVHYVRQMHQQISAGNEQIPAGVWHTKQAMYLFFCNYSVCIILHYD